jgi:ABC-type sugar transport system ATPase subunit
MQDYILEMKDITKTFPGVVALNKVSFSVRRGEIHVSRSPPPARPAP